LTIKGKETENYIQTEITKMYFKESNQPVDTNSGTSRFFQLFYFEIIQNSNPFWVMGFLGTLKLLSHFLLNKNVFQISVWEVSTGRCLKIIAAGAEVQSVAWNPSSHLSLLAIAAGKRLLLCSPQVGEMEKLASTDELLSIPPEVDPNVVGRTFKEHT